MPVIPSSLATALAGHYRLDRELGQGGMATVYLAWDVRQRRVVPGLLGVAGRYLKFSGWSCLNAVGTPTAAFSMRSMRPRRASHHPAGVAPGSRPTPGSNTGASS